MLFDFPMHTIDSALRFPRRAAAKTFDGKFKFGKRKTLKQNKKTSSLHGGDNCSSDILLFISLLVSC